MRRCAPVWRLRRTVIEAWFFAGPEYGSTEGEIGVARCVVVAWSKERLADGWSVRNRPAKSSKPPTLAKRFMSTEDRTLEWVQIVATGAVIIGLALVIWELRQTHDIARAQLISDEYLARMENERTMMGENPAPVIVKGCQTPDELTPAEQRINGAYVTLVYLRNERNRYLAQVSDLGRTLDTSTHQTLRVLLGTPRFRSWYEMNRDRIPPDVVRIGDEIIAGRAEEPCVAGPFSGEHVGNYNYNDINSLHRDPD